MDAAKLIFPALLSSSSSSFLSVHLETEVETGLAEENFCSIFALVKAVKEIFAKIKVKLSQ